MPEEAKQFTPFAMSRFCSLWRCECEYEQTGNLVALWEPLHYPDNLGPDDRPRWDDEKIVFYRPAQKDWVHVNRHLMFSRGAIAPDVVMLPSGLWLEITGAQVVWRDDHWFIRWHGYTNSRAAKLAAAGIVAWKEA